MLLTLFRHTLDRDQDRESPITHLDLKLITPRLQDVEYSDGKMAEDDLQLLERHWKEVVQCVHRAAQDMVEYESNPGGDFADFHFPDRIEMTGEYSIEIRKLTRERLPTYV